MDSSEYDPNRKFNLREENGDRASRDPNGKQINLKIDVTHSGYVVNLGHQAFAIPRVNDEYDQVALVSELKDIKGKYPEKVDAIITLLDDIKYDELIKGMDALMTPDFRRSPSPPKEHNRKCLFTPLEKEIQDIVEIYGDEFFSICCYGFKSHLNGGYVYNSRCLFIMNYSSTGEIIYIPKDVKLPKASQTKELKPAHIVTLTQTDVVLDKDTVAKLDDVKALKKEIG